MTDIKEFIKSVKNKEIDIVEHIHKVLDDVESINKEYNYFNTITRDLAIEQAKKLKKNPKGKLAGVVVSVKDSICVKDVETTAGSRILKGYKPLFHATVIDRVIKEGGIIIGKTAQDEFGFGGFSTNVGLGFKIPKNPFDKQRSTGGSSGGSAGITNKLDHPHLSLGESTGGSIVEPASFCGVVGLCPTYGRVSRYGLIDYANSLDKIGPISQSVYGSALLLETIAGNDKKESTSIDAPVDNYTSFVNKECKDFKIGIIKEAFGEGIDESIQKPIWAMIKKLESEGIKYTEVSLPTPIKYGLSVYYLIGTSEASTNLMKYCGMRYGKHEALDGNFNEYFTKVRSMHLGKEAKRRIVLGTFARMAGYRDAYYLKAAKVRTMMINEYKKAFSKFDVMVTPTAPIQPPKFSEIDKLSILQNYMIDILTVGPNLAGLPHINMNIGFENKLPVGMLLTGDHLDEKKLIQLGSFIEKKR